MIKKQLNGHKIAAKKLDIIKDKAFLFIKNNINKVSEYDVNKFISSEFKKEGMITEKKYPTQIIAFGQNTSFVHYFPKDKDSLIIREDTLVLIDIWAKLNEENTPFADITWMGYTAKNIPEEIKEAFTLVIGAREETIKIIKKSLINKELPKSVKVDNTVINYFRRFNVEKYFTHGAGHSLGIAKVHGTHFRFSKKIKSKMKLEVPFTIEPGLYFKNKFGLRSEINCYINKDYRLVTTTKKQKEIIRI